MVVVFSVAAEVAVEVFVEVDVEVSVEVAVDVEVATAVAVAVVAAVAVAGTFEMLACVFFPDPSSMPTSSLGLTLDFKNISHVG